MRILIRAFVRGQTLTAAGYLIAEQAFATLLTSVFTFGCADIHELREHARHLKPILASTTASLEALTFMVVVALDGFVAIPTNGVKTTPRTELTQAP